LIERLDDRFELVYLQSGPSDAHSERLARRADRHVRLPSTLLEAQEAIAKEELDVLFFPEIGLDPLTYYLGFSRFAPVQCVSWGHPLTTGSPTMDHFISARHLERPDGDADYTEKLWRLETLNSYYERPVNPPRWTRAELGLPEDRRLYGCLQSAFKFHPDYDRVLEAILHRDEKGSLLLASPRPASLQDVIVERWRRYAPIVAERAIWVEPLELDRFLRVLQLCDAVLAPIQFGAGRSALDSFGVGAPLVTFEGPFLKSRIAYAAYMEMQMPDLVAHSEEEYIDLAHRLANDLDFQPDMRRKIAERADVLYESQSAVREFNEFFAAIAPV
jgi:protein O-GlcNAc transferase